MGVQEVLLSPVGLSPSSLTFHGYTDNPKHMRQNSYLDSWNQQDDSAIFPRGVTTRMFPNGTVSTPFIWQYFSEEFEMYFYAGFL